MIAALQTKVISLRQHLIEDRAAYQKRIEEQHAFMEALRAVTGIVAGATCFATSGAAGCGTMASSVAGLVTHVHGAAIDFSKCIKCNLDQAFILEAMKASADIAAIGVTAAAARALQPQLKQGKALPAMLPKLVSGALATDRLQTSLDLFKQEIIKQSGTSGGTSFVADITDWCHSASRRVSLFYTCALCVGMNTSRLSRCSRAVRVHVQLLRCGHAHPE